MIIEFEKPVENKDLLKINDISEAVKVKENTWRISGKDETDIRSSLFKWAVENNHTILSMQKQEQRLEDIFQQLTGN